MNHGAENPAPPVVLRGDLQAAPRPRQRADAVRNRAQILSAAEQLFAAQDPRAVTMDQIAKAAGVGRATLYRCFPDPPAVATALLDEHEKRLQGQMIYGPPPLGPGAPPAERLAAFYMASLGLLEQHLPLALGAETGRARYVTGAYGFWRLHVRTLLAAGGAHDPDALADIALGPLAPELYHHQRQTLGIPQERIAAALSLLARNLLDPARN
ncbi:TetR/AcrR family transcriptional regulator [Streptomyces sp. NBC_00249]|uniref:TetR/AcrR family transcriptional regulator n=1 Tax=Streptomyces sp. NBC_00249 TaxID=2975690 RepID=UPI00225906FD|nr:TetR/AcrR family transcriptional regulator [Streptomyces sp. NBC_00249]MCX5199585.1 TetR/AcrR family transcriptional regulator [Streptomyces sp. NBC_00249]